MYFRYSGAVYLQLGQSFEDILEQHQIRIDEGDTLQFQSLQRQTISHNISNYSRHHHQVTAAKMQRLQVRSNAREYFTGQIRLIPDIYLVVVKLAVNLHGNIIKLSARLISDD